jgi:hypothetical protein
VAHLGKNSNVKSTEHSSFAHESGSSAQHVMFQVLPPHEQGRLVYSVFSEFVAPKNNPCVRDVTDVMEIEVDGLFRQLCHLIAIMKVHGI